MEEEKRGKVSARREGQSRGVRRVAARSGVCVGAMAWRWVGAGSEMNEGELWRLGLGASLDS